MASGLIGAGALASNLSLLPLLFGSSSTSTGAAGDLSGAASTDPFASVVAQAESAPFVSQNFLSNLAAGHSVISAAAPLLAPDALIPGTPGGGTPESQATQVSTFVNALDQALQAPGAGSAFSNLPGVLESQSSALAAIGITTDSTGKIAVDTTKLVSALSTSPGTVRNLLQGPNGLAQVASTDARALVNQTLGLPGGTTGSPTAGILGPSLGLLLNVQA